MRKITELETKVFGCAELLRCVKQIYPEFAGEIDRAVFDIGKYLPQCSDPNCTCEMSFENFRGTAAEDRAHRTEDF